MKTKTPALNAGVFVSGIPKDKILYNNAMTSLLAIESSTDACSVAISHNTILQETFVIRPREHNGILLPMVDELLKNLHLNLADLDAIAFGAGPGSFTGLRLSASIVQGLAFAAQKPVIPISSLAALAYSAGEQMNTSSPLTLLVAVDARMQDIYFGAYRYEQGSLIALATDELLPISQLMKRAENYSDAITIGNGWPSVITTSENLSGLNIYPHAKAVLTLAKIDFLAGKTLSAEQALPAYLRETISWQKWQPKSGPKPSLSSS